MLAGLIRDEERTTLSGVPGLSDLPLIGRLFANNQRKTQQTDIILTLTPHIVRVLDLSEEDLRPFRLGRDSARGGRSAAAAGARASRSNARCTGPDGPPSGGAAASQTDVPKRCSRAARTRPADDAAAVFVIQPGRAPVKRSTSAP